MNHVRVKHTVRRHQSCVFIACELTYELNAELADVLNTELTVEFFLSISASVDFEFSLSCEGAIRHLPFICYSPSFCEKGLQRGETQTAGTISVRSLKIP